MRLVSRRVLYRRSCSRCAITLRSRSLVVACVYLLFLCYAVHDNEWRSSQFVSESFTFAPNCPSVRWFDDASFAVSPWLTIRRRLRAAWFAGKSLSETSGCFV
jgi:hypothetical protein